MDVIREARVMFDNYQIATEILAASIRHPRHVVEAAMIGADVATLPPDVLKKRCCIRSPIAGWSSSWPTGASWRHARRPRFDVQLAPLQRYASRQCRPCGGSGGGSGCGDGCGSPSWRASGSWASTSRAGARRAARHLDDADLERAAEHEKRIRTT